MTKKITVDEFVRQNPNADIVEGPDGKYLVEDAAIATVMQEAQSLFPNIPAEVTCGIHILRANLSDIHEALCTPDNEHLADKVADCISLTRELFNAIEAGFDEVCGVDETLN